MIFFCFFLTSSRVDGRLTSNENRGNEKVNGNLYKANKKMSLVKNEREKRKRVDIVNFYFYVVM